VLASDPDPICGGCSDCLDACPGQQTGAPESEMELFGRVRTREERWLGIYRRLVRARSLDRDIYQRSASGGCATSLLLAVHQYMHLDYLVVAGRDPHRRWMAASMVCRTRDDLLKSTQSTYQLFAHLRVLKDLYERDPRATIAFVGLPCQVQALRKLQRMSGPIAEYARSKVKLIVEIACSSNTLPEATERLITDRLHLPLADVSDVRFRDGDYPGDFVVETKSKDRHRLEFWTIVEFLKDYKTHRCLSCGDWMSGLADLSVCDGDPNIFKSSVNHHERVPKHGRVFVRTPLGEVVVRNALQGGLIELWEGNVERMNLGLDRKRNRRAFYERSGRPIPDPPVPGYREAAPAMTDEEVLRVSLTR
jgi:coenzyme F420 hydrogenase subunit beta